MNYPSILRFVFTFLMFVNIATASDRGDVLFYAPFDGDTRVSASGSGEVQEKGGGALEFGPGYRGQALRSGELLALLNYEVDGNLLSDRGTIEMWISPENWEGSDSLNHLFFSAGGRGELWIYKHRAPGNSGFLIGADGTPATRDVISQNISSWQKGEWHHVVVTWDTDQANFYIDGVPASPRLNPPVPNALSGQFQIGDFVSDGPGDVRTLIDEVYIYGRALSEAEVAWTFAHAKDRPAGGDLPAELKPAR